MSLNEKSDAGRRLDKRYEECDRDGHKMPDVGKNNCNYCFRRLEYEKCEEVDRIIASRQNIPLMQQPIDASYLAQKERGNIELQKYMDRHVGLLRIAKESD